MVGVAFIDTNWSIKMNIFNTIMGGLLILVAVFCIIRAEQTAKEIKRPKPSRSEVRDTAYLQVEAVMYYIFFALCLVSSLVVTGWR